MTYTGPVYSPTQTEKFIRCPALWDFSRRWEGPDAHWMQKLIGKAIHHGAMTFYKGLMDPSLGADPTSSLEKYFTEHWPEDHDLERDSSFLLAKKALSKVLALKLMTDEDTVLSVEQPMGVEGCIPDLVIQHNGSHPWIEVVDWKYGHSISAFYLQKRLDEAQTLWQLKHYAWRVGTLYPEIPVTRTAMALIIGTPKSEVKTASVEVTPESTEMWFKSAEQVWQLINATRAGTIPAWKAYGQACGLYGGCAFWDGCHRHHGNEERFANLYTPKEPSK